MNKELQNIQIALMFQTVFSGSFDGISSLYQQSYPSAQIKKVPLPEDFPEDSIPRLEIICEDFTALFAKNRADIFFKSSCEYENVLDFFVKIIIDLRVVIGRVGYVQKELYTDIEMDDVRKVLGALSVIENDDDVLEATQRINKRTVVKYGEMDLECNNIAALALGKKDQKTALLLERDVNTRQDKNLSLQDKSGVLNIVKLLEGEAGSPLFLMKL